MGVKYLFILLFIFCSYLSLLAQETTLKLPTNDNTSGFNVTKNNGTSVLKVDGSGKMAGDGSGLSNVKPLINYLGGSQHMQITANFGSYNNVRSVDLTAPSSGVCVVMASGYLDWESTGWDLALLSILMDSDPNISWAAENEFWNNWQLVTDYNCPDSSDQYTGFSLHRCIPVTAGTHTFKLWANKYSSSALVKVGNVSMSAIFIPTGGTGEAAMSIASTTLEGNNTKRIDGSLDGTNPHDYSDDQTKLPITDNKIIEEQVLILKKENEALKRRLDAIEKLILEKK